MNKPEVQALKKKRFRILALDGGGIRGIFSVAVLEQLEKSTNCRVMDHFDLIVGTSTGGILAIGLGMGKSPTELRELYYKERKHIFPPIRAEKIKHMMGPKYNQDGLKAVLEKVLEGKKLGDSKVRLVIPVFDAEKGTACTFKTAHHSRLQHEYALPAIEVALATSAAPTFFPARRIADRLDGAYMDGGVWANCPVMVGIVEALHFLGQPLDAIDMLSVGTVNEQAQFALKAEKGVLGWSKGLIDVMMAGQVTSAVNQAQVLLGDRFCRIDIPQPEGTFALDDSRTDTVKSLQALGASIAKGTDIKNRVQTMFLNGVLAEPFVPIYG